MNNLRISILSLTIILFSLGALMLPVNTTLAHHCKGGHSGDPICPVGGSNGGKDFATYSVVISGAVSGGTTETNWREGFVGKNGIGLNAVAEDISANYNVGELDLSFFKVPADSGPFSDKRGENCFGAPGTSVYLGQAILKSRKHGQVEGQFWFRGHTDTDAVDGMTEVSYLLTVVGSFDEKGAAWPPSDPNSPTTTMIMDTWEMGVGESGAIQNMSCVGDGDFLTDVENYLDDFVLITVTLVE